jgi:hypothetical protein
VENKEEIFTNRKALSLAKGIPIDHIKAAKALSCAGIRPNGRIYWVEFEPWYKQNLPAIEEYLEENDPQTTGRGVWKERKERALALIAEIELRDREQKTLDKDKVLAFIKQIAGSQAIVLRNMAQDLPPRLLGKNITEMGVILSENYDEVCGIFNDSLNKWLRK